MAKNTQAGGSKSIKSSKPVSSAAAGSDLKRPGAASFLPLAACVLYFVVHFIPDMGGYDAMGAQWIYVVLLDAVLALFILARRNDYRKETSDVVTNLFSKLYLVFFVLAGLSTLTAINPTEGWVCYVRMIATVVAYFNLAILFQNRLDIFRILAQVTAVLLAVESIQTINQFVENSSTSGSLTELIMGLKGEAGNKNIFAAGLVIKVPFVLYCIYNSKMLVRILNMVILLLGATAIFLVNARASYLSLIVVTLLYLAFTLISYVKDRKLEQGLFRAAYILIPLLIGFFVAEIQISNAASTQAQKDVNFGLVTERLASFTETQDESNQVRFRLWQHAVDYTIHHPLIGCGIGNWKIASIPYQRAITNDLYVPIHAHNDFVEVFAELGIPGGLLYLAMFVCLAVLAYRTFYSAAREETKLVAVFSLMAFATYAVDAMFNFPLERPVSQVFFAICVSLIVSAYLQSRKETGEEKPVTAKTALFKPIYGLIALLMLLPSFYITWLTYKSLIVQKTVLGDLNNEPLKLDWKEVVPSFPPIPNLTATAQPVEAIKGRYLYEAGPEHYAEALRLYDKGRKANPVIGYSEFLKAGLYYKSGQTDSAFRNATVAFYLRPKAKTYYQTLVAVLARMNDTANMTKAFHEFDRYRHYSYGPNMYLMGMLNVEKNQNTIFPQLPRFVDSVLKIYPNDSDLLVRRNEINSWVAIKNAAGAGIDILASQKYFQAGFAAFGAGKLQEAADNFVKSFSIDPKNVRAIENAGVCYFNMRQYAKSINYFDRVIDSKLYPDNGEPHYYKGIAMINLGKRDAGCELLHYSSKRGWVKADEIIKTNCK